ncbi:hypothetical protein [Burkholderia gladioli]|uniref:hypothetical protein n=1 Tax=Burkholderia gladioli TaxID=28095 RepID=UPI001640E161|nr:hypothetical protein [Burkholderia gladioli]
MVNVFHVKLKLPDGACAPDSMGINRGFYPHDNFVISRHVNGDVLSRFGDSVWDISPYDGRGENRIIGFSFWGRRCYDKRRQAIVGAAKKLMFILMWRRSGPPYAASTLVNYSRLLTVIAQYCFDARITVEELLANKTRAVWFARSVGARHAKSLLALSSVLRQIDTTQSGFSVFPSNAERPIQKIALIFRESALQVAPIPTRIYEEAIVALFNELSDFEAIEHELLHRLDEILNIYASGKHRTRHCSMSQSYARRNKLLREGVSPELFGYLSARGLRVHTYDLIKAVTRVQLVCRAFLYAFSGARNKELVYAPFDCLRIVVVDGIRYYILISTTTKFNNGIPRYSYWPTCQDATPFVECAQRICSFVYPFSRGHFPKISEKIDKKSTPLFLSTGYLYRGRRAPKRPNRPTTVNIERNMRIFHGADLCIREEDVVELEEIDKFRAWRHEARFKIGARWLIHSHQFRRSLAMYAKASGLVRSTTLRRVLKQASVAMADYYARGSESAKDLLAQDPHHMCSVYQDNEAESEALLYLRNLVHSKDEWSGPLASFVDRYVRGKGTGSIMETLSAVKAQVELGQLAYRETSLGGCGNPGPCHERSMRSLVSCLGCESGGINGTKLNNVIEKQEQLVASLSIGTMEHTVEAEDLRALKEYRTRKFG